MNLQQDNAKLKSQLERKTVQTRRRSTRSSSKQSNVEIPNDLRVSSLYISSFSRKHVIAFKLLRVEEHRTRHQKRMQMREIYSQIISTLPDLHTSTLPNFHTSTLPDFHTSTLPNFHTARLPHCRTTKAVY